MSGVYLRALESQDIDVWCGWFNSTPVTDFMNKGIFPNTVEKQTEFFLRISNSQTDVQLGICLREQSIETLVGIIGIHGIDWVHRRGDVSIVLGSHGAGKGVGTAAIGLIVRHGFEKMNLRKLTAGMWANNFACIRAFAKNGFVREGVLKESYHYKWGYVDELRYGLIRPDWEKAQA